MSEVPTGPRIDDIRRYRPSFVGMAGLACVPFLVWASVHASGVLVAVGLTLLWVVLFLLACASFTRHPWRVVVLGVLALAAWVVALVV